jgi:hypothetical protein
MNLDVAIGQAMILDFGETNSLEESLNGNRSSKEELAINKNPVNSEHVTEETVVDNTVYEADIVSIASTGSSDRSNLPIFNFIEHPESSLAMRVPKLLKIKCIVFRQIVFYVEI